MLTVTKLRASSMAAAHEYMRVRQVEPFHFPLSNLSVRTFDSNNGQAQSLARFGCKLIEN